MLYQVSQRLFQSCFSPYDFWNGTRVISFGINVQKGMYFIFSTQVCDKMASQSQSCYQFRVTLYLNLLQSEAQSVTPNKQQWQE